MKTIHLFLSFALFIFPLVGFSQDGAFDITFGNNGSVLTNINNNSDYSSDVIQQADGKLVMSGYSFGSGNSNTVILRHLTNGDLDASFGNDGIVITDIGGGSSEVNFQNNSEILIGIKSFSSYTVQRYTTGGALDTTFADNGTLIPDEVALKIVVLGDDSFLLLGSTTNGTDSLIVLQKYLPDGNIDSLFGTNGVSTIQIPFGDAQLSGFKTQSDGSIIVLSTRRLMEASEVILTKFLPNGTLDNSFGINGSVNYSIDVLPDHDWIQAAFDIAENDKIIVVGSFGDCDVLFQPFLLRYLPNGQLDFTFGNSGLVTLTQDYIAPFKVIIQENNRILVGENVYDCFEWSHLSIRRFYENGSVDSSFSLNNSGWEEDGVDFILQDDGKIVAIGTTPWFNGNENFYLGRYNNNPLGIPGFETEKFKIFPNPSEGVFTLKKSVGFDSEINYIVTDVSGKIILEGTLKNSETTINLSEGQTGIYFLKAFNTTLKLLKN